MKKEVGKNIISEKVEDFKKNVLILKKKGHGETNIRSNYIDVFFEALGWNMKSHYDVVREFSQRDTSGTKKVDYAFKVNGKLKFFVEAKEASIDLVNDKDSIYQAKRYAYSTNGKAPIVILTDFEEFRVFNVLKAPDYNNTDRELLKKHCMEFSAYLDNWDLLWDTFSKEAVTAGSLEALRGKIDKNTKTMDVDFLEQITGWREDLARNIAIRNKDLSVDELNEAVQRILDRLLFIRNLEDREIESENTLLDKTKKAEDIYKSIIPLFNNLDNVYNGLLFKKHFSEELAVDDKTIKDIIKSMCYPISPFQFDVIEPEILGRIYEKFLGSKIRLTENHQAKIEEKIEVRKAGGVYYTPEYIVHYIVENTVGKKIEGLNPEEIKKIKIVDPACGSGSFLLGAYSYLLDYHQKWYLSHKSEKSFKNDYYVTKDGELKVNLDKRGNILRNNIFGVDIDKEATEVAIMSLYLKMLDDGFDKGERDLFFIKGHVLPDMTDNVKCGNSLIGTDYFDGKLDFDIQEMKEIKTFDWDNEFTGIFNTGGFDCVIGNPPYVRQEMLTVYKPYFEKHYRTYHGVADLYVYFIEKGIKLLKEEGFYSIIVANKWMRANYGLPLRNYLKTAGLDEIIDFGDLPVFQDATTYPCILTVNKTITNKKNIKFNAATVEELSFDELSEYLKDKRFKLSLEDLNPEGWTLCDEKTTRLLDKLKKAGLPLEEYVQGKIFRGVLTGLNDAFVIDAETKNKLISEDPKSEEILRPFLSGKNIKRYCRLEPEKYLILFPKGWTNERIKGVKNAWSWLEANYEAIARHLKPYEEAGKKRCDKGDYWWELRACDFYMEFEKPKLIYPNICNRNIFTYDENSLYTNQKCFIISLDDKSLLGILNSSTFNFLYKQILPKLRGGFFEPSYVFMKDMPVPSVSNEEKVNLITLVDQMLQTQKDFHNSKSESDKKLYEQKINILDKKIDDLVYKLYGLTEEEIKIVEGSN